MAMILALRISESMAKTRRRASLVGIRERHSRSCAAAEDPDGRCRCSPTFEASVYSKRDGAKFSTQSRWTGRKLDLPICATIGSPNRGARSSMAFTRRSNGSPHAQSAQNAQPKCKKATLRADRQGAWVKGLPLWLT
jgi:hypothetical protein